MKAVVIHRAGGPEVLKLESRPMPVPGKGEVRIAVKAFGLNRSELFTRQGHSPSVVFPRILGIEAVGIVDAAPGGEFAQGAMVATVMGGMGRQFDGSYAEFTCVPAAQVRRLTSTLDWEVLGALPEMLQTAWGALFSSLNLQAGHRLLVRGGTTSVGMAAIALARRAGADVTATTRRQDRRGLLKMLGTDRVLIDDGELSKSGNRFDRILELIGATTLEDSLLCADRGSLVCMAGIVGNTWTMPNFAPMDAIPNRVALTSYSGEPEDFMSMPLQDLLDDIAGKRLNIKIGRVFSIDEIVDAHRCMEANAAEGKIVILV
ncbi:MAG: NADPH:quinone reductase [Hyphomicrobiales bacterium]|nr:MAG: NADPH:quinone reductase [Hyphomicrobiales bacterium]